MGLSLSLSKIGQLDHKLWYFRGSVNLFCVYLCISIQNLAHKRERFVSIDDTNKEKDFEIRFSTKKIQKVESQKLS